MAMSKLKDDIPVMLEDTDKVTVFVNNPLIVPLKVIVAKVRRRKTIAVNFLCNINITKDTFIKT